MIRGPILRVVAALTFPFSVLLTFYFLVSGHNNPGGGFIAGVLMSGAIALQFIAYGTEDVPRFLKLPYERIVALGFVIAVIAATAPLAVGDPFLTSYHATLDVPVLGAKMEFALAQLFDFGIFLLVAAGVMTAVLALAEDDEDKLPHESPPSQSSPVEGEEEREDSGLESSVTVPSGPSSIESEEVRVDSAEGGK